MGMTFSFINSALCLFVVGGTMLRRILRASRFGQSCRTELRNDAGAVDRLRREEVFRLTLDALWNVSRNVTRSVIWESV